MSRRCAHGGDAYWLRRVARMCGLALYMTDPIVPPREATLIGIYCGLGRAATADD